MHYFYLAIDGETTLLSTAFLPRVGDTIVHNDREATITKVTWITDGAELQELPIVNAHLDQVVVANETPADLAMRLARKHWTNNKKIPAIKDFRAITGASLAEAKDYIDEAWKAMPYTRRPDAND